MAAPLDGDPLLAIDLHRTPAREERRLREDEAGEGLLGARALHRHADVGRVLEILEVLGQREAHWRSPCLSIKGKRMASAERRRREARSPARRSRGTWRGAPPPPPRDRRRAPTRAR